MRSKMMRLALVFLMIGGFATLAIAGGPQGGLADCDCIDPDIHIAKKGPFVKGDFTISPSKDSCAVTYPDDCGHLDIHMFLRKGHTTELYSFATAAGKSLCDEDLADFIKREYARQPCLLGVEEDFGFEGTTPIIKEVIITDRSGCDTVTESDDMVRGEIIIGFIDIFDVVNSDGTCVGE